MATEIPTVSHVIKDFFAFHCVPALCGGHRIQHAHELLKSPDVTGTFSS